MHQEPNTSDNAIRGERDPMELFFAIRAESR